MGDRHMKHGNAITLPSNRYVNFYLSTLVVTKVFRLRCIAYSLQQFYSAFCLI